MILARSGLDHETMTSYKIKILLNTLSAFINTAKKITEVHVTVLDKNDNAPMFHYTASYNDLIPDSYLVSVTRAGQLIFIFER